MRDDMLRTLDRIVEDTVTQKLRASADERGNQGADAPTAGTLATSPLWLALSEAGITGLGNPEADGDISFADTMALVRRAAYHALPVPLGEVIMVRRLRARHGLAAPDGMATLAPPGAGKDIAWSGTKLSGWVQGVPSARDMAHILVAAGEPGKGHLVLADIAGQVARRGANMAGEPRDEIDVSKAKVIASAAAPHAVWDLEGEGALLRSVQMAGAIDATLDHCLTWVGDRVQFGKPIAKHQAVQHLMAQLAGESAAASASVDMAVEASAQAPDRLAIAMAKARVGEAAGKAANIAHGVFGAMGFTREHQLHYSTRRLWAWRNEFGNEAVWQATIGWTVANLGGRQLWSTLTARG